MNFLTRATVTAVAVFVMGVDLRAEVPAFLILQDGGAFADHVRAVEGAGGRIRHRVPPRILIVDLPDGSRPSTLPGIQSAYTTAVPVSILEPQGPVAVAAGLQWNRRLLASANTPGSLSLGAMRQLVADRSLAAPASVSVTSREGRLSCEWSGVDGAAYYELQVSDSRYFETIRLKTRAVRTRVEVARPMDAALYVRVRAVDPGEATADDDVFGRWSSEAPVGSDALAAEGGTAPTLTSPADRLETEGFTLILEWAPGEGPARVQVARDAGFTDTVFDEVVSGGEYACPGPALRTGDRLHWRVRSLNGVRSPWSSSRQVSIGEPRSHAIDAFINPEAPK